MTSSVKPEVHNIFHAVRGGPSHGHVQQAQKNLVKFGRTVFELCGTDRQTDAQTDRLITILRNTNGAK